jgi:tetratricopeptide (TPR) repeat protein
MDVAKRISSLLVSVLFWQVAAADPLGDLSKIFSGFGNPKFDLNIQHPPTVPLKVTTVAIAKPDGQCSEDLATRVEEDFVGAGVTVIDRQRLEDVLAEHKLQVSALIDQKTAAKVGALLGAQALLFLKVLDCHGGKDQQNLGTDKKGHTSYNYVVQETVSGSVRVVSLTSGQVLASQRFEGSGEATNYEGYPDPAIALGDAEKSAAFSVHKLLLPWKETKHIVFYSDSQCDLRIASGMLKSQDIDGALAQSEKNLAGCPATPKVKPATVAHAYYNLGILQFMKDDFGTALTNLNEALKLDSSRVYIDAIADCKRAKELSVAVEQYQKELLAQNSPDNSKPSSKAVKIARTPAGDVKQLTPSASGTPSVADRLSNLDDLLKRKLITQEEYNAKRAQILGGI